MSLERHVDLRINVVTPRQHGFGLTAERLARLFDVPVAMAEGGMVRRAHRSDHVWGHAVDLPPGIGRQLRRPAPWPVLQTRATRRGERRRVARQLRETARERRTEAAIRRVHASITRGDAWYRGTAPDLTRGARP